VPKSKDEEIQLERLKLILPLMENNLDRTEFLLRQRSISEDSGLSKRTIGRWIKSYRENGLKGLLPAKSGRPTSSIIPPSIISQDIVMRREQPKRSINNIIRCLEINGSIPEGSVKRSTLQYQMFNHKFGKSHIKHYIATNDPGGMRFQRTNRNDLWQSDGKVGIQIGKLKTHLICFIDDSTRFILHSEFYKSESIESVCDCFKKSIAKYGLPDSIYTDNGKAFTAIKLTKICGELGIHKRLAKPRTPKSKGKIERLFQFADSFIDELRLDPVDNLVDLNIRWQEWVEAFYQTVPHSSLKDHMSPMDAFNSDKKPLKLVSSECLENVFMSIRKRGTIDKSGCISLNGQKFTADGLMAFVKQKCDIIWNMEEPPKVWVVIDDTLKIEVSPLEIKPWVPLPSKTKRSDFILECNRSKLLEAAHLQHQKNEEERFIGLYGPNWKQVTKEAESVEKSSNNVASTETIHEVCEHISDTENGDSKAEVSKIHGISFTEMKIKPAKNSQICSTDKKGISFSSVNKIQNTDDTSNGED
jgi:transposase InsO family protein